MIYAVVEDGLLGNHYTYFHKLENAKKKLEETKKEFKELYKYEIKELTDEDIKEYNDFKYGGFYYKRSYGSLIVNTGYDSVYIEEIKTED